MTDHVDAMHSRALLQGAVVGSIMRMQAEQGPVLVDSINQQTDDNGWYLHHFTVTLRSGAQVKISMELVGALDTAAEAAEVRARDIEDRVKADIETTLRRYGVRAYDPDQQDDLMSDLVNDAMHQVEHLLTEVRQ